MSKCSPCYAPDGSFVDHFREGLPNTLTSGELSYINNRYIILVEESANEACSRNLQFHLLVNIITLSGILTATFTSLSYSDKVPDHSRSGLFWTVIVLGLVSAMANKLVYLFNIPKKYILAQQAMKRYEAEGWHFLTGIGKYNRTDSADRFKIFCDRVEKIQAKRVREMTAANSSATAATLGSSQPDDNGSLGSPTPRTPASARSAKQNNQSGSSANIPADSIVVTIPPDNVGQPSNKSANNRKVQLNITSL